MATFQATTVHNRSGALPRVNDKIVVDGVPADVTKVDVYEGISYQVRIPGLKNPEGGALFVPGKIAWADLLELTQVTD